MARGEKGKVQELRSSLRISQASSGHDGSPKGTQLMLQKSLTNINSPFGVLDQCVDWMSDSSAEDLGDYSLLVPHRSGERPFHISSLK